LFFAESPLERDYRLPEVVANAKVVERRGDQKPSVLDLKKVEEDDFIGRRAEQPAPTDAALETTVQYGVYHGMLLDYYVKGLTHVAPKHWSDSAKSESLLLNLTPRLSGKGIDVLVTWKGKPLADVKVTMIDSAGSSTEAQTGADGVAQFEAPQEGLVGFMANRTDDKATGEHDGKEYTSAGQYATVTVRYANSAPGAKKVASSPLADISMSTASALPALPEPLASFGGAVCDGYLYIYGGHIGEEHDHSKDNLSAHFRRVKLDGGKLWEDLPMQTLLQGLPLVAHRGKLYRVGGLNFRNAADDEPDMHSVDEFACYDPATGKWTALPSLPEPRSSHDAVVIGDTLYVVGGWTLKGESRGDWLPTAWTFDLSKPDAAWQPLPAPSFKRRALAVAPWNGKLVALGGMDDDDQVSRSVDALDFRTGQWAKLPELPGGGQMRGFGVSAWDLGGDLFVSGSEGIVYRLSDNGEQWIAVGKLQQPRFFHRLLPLDASTLLAVAGANFKEGHLANIEVIAATAPN